MILFGEFLVEKKLIDVNIFIELAYEQIRKTPSIFEVIYKKKLLSSNKILNALKYQASMGCEFKIACVELNYWSQEISNEVQKDINEVQNLTWKELMSRGLLDSETIVKALDEFLSSIKKSSLNCNTTDLDHLEFTVSSDAEHENFFGNFGESEQNEILIQIKSWENSVSENNMADLVKCIQDLSFSFQAIQGLARLAHAELLSRLIGRVHPLLVKMLSLDSVALKAEVQGLASCLTQMMVQVSELRKTLIQSKSEKSYWENSEHKKNYLNVIDAIEKFQFKMTHLEIDRSAS